MAKYLYSIFSNIPNNIYILLGLVLLVGIFIINSFSSQRKRYVFLLILVEYIAIIFMTTVVYRSTPLNGGVQLIPFWSYRSIDGSPSLIMENLTNIIAFAPIGFLLGYCFAGMSWWKVLGMGVLISLCIELLQLVFNKGLCELDDVMHNTLGCVIGYGIYRLIYACVNSKKKRIYDK